MECPFCLETVKEGAFKCPHCQSLLRDYKTCPRCMEQVIINARQCRHCGLDLLTYERSQRIQAGLEKPEESIFEATASPIGALATEGIFTALFFPPEIKISSREVVIKRKTLLGLRTTDMSIPLQKIASVRFVKGVIWGGIVFESYGGGVPDLVINGLDKNDALSMVKILDDLLAKMNLERK